MPLISATSLTPHTQLAVWHITEPESYFEEVAATAKFISHPHKRLQHLCGRYLLRHLVPHFPLGDLVAEQNNKPFLPGHPYHFSISHTASLAAAIVSTRQQVGVDVEVFSKKVVLIRQKFLTVAEEAMLVNDCPQIEEEKRLILAWSAKETLFKWLGEAGVDFKAHLHLLRITPQEESGLIVAQIQRTTSTPATLGYRLTNEWVLTWLATDYHPE